jgi:CheY-like chemotaxis protein
MAKEILIGDSDKTTQKEFEKILGTSDYHLLFSGSGEDVLLRVKLFKPDLIIAGTTLPEKNGYKICEAIKNDPDFKSIPFILLRDKSEEISEKDRDRLKPDGILSKPIDKSELLALVERLLEAVRPKEGKTSGKKMVLETFADMGEERFASNQTDWTEEEEVIDLLDVVEDAAEEPESKMSIDDFVVPGKAEPFGEIPALESWEKLGEEEKVAAEEGLVLSVEGEKEEAQDFPYKLREEASPPTEAQEEDLFEKIELEDILEKVGRIELPPEREQPAERGFKVSQEDLPPIQEVEEKPFAFDEFEIALKKGVEVEATRQEAPQEKALQPFSIEERKEEVGEKEAPFEIPIEEKAEAIGEEFPKGLFEDMLKEGELREEGLEEKKLIEEELKGEELEEEELKEEGLQEEELQEEGLLEEELKAEELFEEEELPEEEGTLEEEFMEVGKPLEEETLKVVRELNEEEKTDLFEGLEALEVPGERKRVIGETPETIAETAEAIEAHRLFEAEVTPPLRRVGQRMEAVISEKVQGMMEEFVTKHVPEMTKDIVQLTIERLERMVREIVPDLAEKMIEEEIKRLEKGEKR